MPRTLHRTSVLLASPEALWRHATDPAGVNRELRPLLRMTFPPGLADLASVHTGARPAFRSWLLLFGVLPVEYDDLSLVEIEPGRRFLERSRLLTQRVWEHERVIEPAPGGARLTDRVRFEPRVGVLAPIHAVVFGWVFRLRHRNLRRAFGDARA